MSNAAVGLVYDTIIAEVINAVRVDFEENGVDDGALEDLKKVRLYRSPSLSSTSRPLPLAAFPPPCLAFSHLRQSNQVYSFDSPSGAASRMIFFCWFGVDFAGQNGTTSVGHPSAASDSGARGGGEQPIWVGDPVLLGLFLSSSPIAANSPNHSRATSDWPI
jgi:hypothetical protein